MSCYFNQEGEILSAIDCSIAEALSSFDLNEANDYIAKNCGYICLYKGKNSVTISWRPSRITEPCIASLMYYLFDEKISRCVLKTYNDSVDDWDHQIFNVQLAFASFLTFTARQMEPFTSKMRRAPLTSDVAACFMKISPLLEFWKKNNRIADRSTLEGYLSDDLGERYVMLKDSSLSGMVLDELGKGMPAFAYNNLASVLNRPFVKQPDSQYGSACVEAYKQAAQMQQPLIEIVEASVNWADYGRLQRRYARLILPLEFKNGQKRVLVSSIPLNSNFAQIGAAQVGI
jgi:hypothetical protein